MRVLCPPSDQERSKSPLPSSVTRLRPSIPVNIRPRLPLSNKSRTPSSDERALLTLDHPTSFGSSDEIDYAIQPQPIRKSKKVAVSSMQASVQRNAKQFASNVKNVRIHLPAQLNPRPQKRGSQYVHREFLETESRDDELDYLLSSSEGHLVFRMSDLETMREQRESDPAPIMMEAVDFGGFDVVRETCKQDREVDSTTGTVTVSDASIGASTTSAALSVESGVNEFSLLLNALVENLENKSYTKMYEQICRGGVHDDEEENKHEMKLEDASISSASTRSTSTRSAKPSKAEASISSASAKSASTRSSKQLSNTEDDGASISSSIGSVKSVKEMNDAFQLTVADSVVSKGHHSRISSSSNSSHLHGVYFVRESDESSAPIEEESSQSLLDEADEIEVYNSRSDSSDGGSGEFQVDATPNVVVEIDTAEDPGAQVSPMEDASVQTPEEPTKSINSVPNMSFSFDGASQVRRFLISHLPVVVIPTEYGDVVLTYITDPSSKLDCKESEEVSPDVVSVDLEPKFMRNLLAPHERNSDICHDAPTLASIGSEESSSSNGNASSELSWGGLEVRHFDDEVFNEKAEQCAEKDEEDSVFMERDDWKPEDDSESTCSQPFGCCTVNVDIRRSLLGASEKLKSLIESGQVVYPESNMLDAISEVESDVATSQSSTTTNSAHSTSTSSEMVSFTLSDHIIDLLEQKESDSGDEYGDDFFNTNDSLIDEDSVEDNESSQDKTNGAVGVQISEDSVTKNSSSDGSDNISIGERSDGSPIEIEHNGCSSAISDVGAANFDELRDFWAQEWAEATTDDQSEDLNDFNYASSATESECQVLSDIIDFVRFESVEMELDSPSCVSRSRLETVKEEVAEETDDDTTSGATCAEASAANVIEDSDCGINISSSASELFKVEDQGAGVEEVDASSQIAREVCEDDLAEETNDQEDVEGLCVSDIGAAEDFVPFVVENITSDDKISLHVDDITRSSSQQLNFAFHKSRHTKKRYVQVKKWAVAKAKTKKASKFSLEVRREPRSKDVDNADAESIHSAHRASEVDDVVTRALDLLANRPMATLADIPEKETLRDQPSVKYKPSSPFLANLENLRSRHSSIPRTILCECGSTNESGNMPSLTIPVDYESDLGMDRLGLLQNYLSPRAKENRLGGDVGGSNTLNSEKPPAEEEDEKNEAIVSGIVIEEEKNQDRPVDEEDVACTEHNEDHPSAKEATVIEKSVQDEQVDGKAKGVTENPTFMQFDDVHPPKLGTLTQKLFYTNTELAETLAMTQSELEVASKRVNMLALERDELLEAVAKQAKFLGGSRSFDSSSVCSRSAYAKSVGSNSSAGTSVVEKEIKELLEWLEEKNELIEI